MICKSGNLLGGEDGIPKKSLHLDRGHLPIGYTIWDQDVACGDMHTHQGAAHMSAKASMVGPAILAYSGRITKDKMRFASYEHYLLRLCT